MRKNIPKNVDKNRFRALGESVFTPKNAQKGCSVSTQTWTKKCVIPNINPTIA
jgi:hypothetical protein